MTDELVRGGDDLRNFSLSWKLPRFFLIIGNHPIHSDDEDTPASCV